MKDSAHWYCHVKNTDFTMVMSLSSLGEKLGVYISVPEAADIYD